MAWPMTCLKLLLALRYCRAAAAAVELVVTSDPPLGDSTSARLFPISLSALLCSCASARAWLSAAIWASLRERSPTEGISF